MPSARAARNFKMDQEPATFLEEGGEGGKIEEELGELRAGRGEEDVRS